MGDKLIIYIKTSVLYLMVFALAIFFNSCIEQRWIDLYQSRDHDPNLVGIWATDIPSKPYIEFASTGYLHEYSPRDDGSLRKYDSSMWYTDNDYMLHICTLYSRPINEHTPQKYKISNDTVYVDYEGKWYPEYIKYNGELK